MVALYIIIPIILIFILTFFRILYEYERGVVFTLGRFWKVKGPGLVVIVPFIQQMVRIELRTIVMKIPPQDVISKDNNSTGIGKTIVEFFSSAILDRVCR